MFQSLSHPPSPHPSLSLSLSLYLFFFLSLVQSRFLSIFIELCNPVIHYRLAQTNVDQRSSSLYFMIVHTMRKQYIKQSRSARGKVRLREPCMWLFDFWMMALNRSYILIDLCKEPFEHFCTFFAYLTSNFVDRWASTIEH